MREVAATERLFQPSYCRVDWRRFDPATLSWRFDGEAYVGGSRHCGRPSALSLEGRASIRPGYTIFPMYASQAPA